MRKKIVVGRTDKDEIVAIEYEEHRGTEHSNPYFSLSGETFSSELITEEQGEERAREYVRSELETEPETFNQDWLRGYLDTDRMIQEMVDDFDDMTDGDMATNWFDEDEIREALDKKEDEDISDVTMSDMQGTEVYDQKAKDRAEDVVNNDLDFETYFPADRLQYYLNIDEAVEDAINSDGWQHFIGDVEEVGDGLYAEMQGCGQIDCSIKPKNFVKIAIPEREINTIWDGWAKLHLKDWDKMTEAEKKYAEHVISIIDRHLDQDINEEIRKLADTEYREE